MPNRATSGPSPFVYVLRVPWPKSHRTLVLEFATLLREKGGVDAHVHEWDPTGRSDRVAAELELFEKADFILVVASPEMRRLMDSSAQGPPGDVTHVSAALFRDLLARSLQDELRRTLPVLLPGATLEDVPDVLRPYSTRFFSIPELTADGIEELLRTLSDKPADVKPPLREPHFPKWETNAAAPALPLAVEEEVLSAGSVLRLAEGTYLVHGEPEERRTEASTAIRRQAPALLVGNPNDRVWLRQVQVRSESPEAKEALAALAREHDLLSELHQPGRGLPLPLELVDTDRIRTLVLAWPRRDTRPGAFRTLADYVPDQGEQLDSTYLRRMLDALAGLCDTLQVLHDQQVIHGELTPAAIVRIDEEHLALRDLGAACGQDWAGAGAESGRAPEQTIRRQGKTGPWTDVFQIAAVAYQLLSGHRPDDGYPLPVQALCPAVPDRQAATIDAALSTDPAQRPAVAELTAALRI